ncbi:MAG: transporter, ATP-binding protein [Steroidobacteraceae bacterium]|nr:transporter, ATP-binding protein [Steroidobacteraceae bacterium]
MTELAIDIEGLAFAWNDGLPVLDIPRFEVRRGERVFLRGPSGSGKSTLLGIVSGVLKAGRGRVRVLGEDLGLLTGGRRDEFRAAHIGLVFQMFNLLPYLSVMDNVLLPARFSAVRRGRAQPDPATEARRLLDELGIVTKGSPARLVTELSIGQQQRVAVARALLGRPELVIADEPTSSLDSDARDGFIRLLMSECSATGATLLFVSHDTALGGLFDRQLSIGDINRARPQLEQS